MMTHTMIVLLEFHTPWLALSREERRPLAKDIYHIVDEYKNRVQVRFFDAEALPGANFTDFCICETKNLKDYHYMWEKIRDTAAYAQGYFKIKDVIMGMENAYQSFEIEELHMPLE